MTAALILVGIALLTVAAGLTLWRLSTGPSTLDRIVASDVLVIIVIASIGFAAVVFRDDTGLPILLVLSLVGFTGAVSVARLVASAETQRRKFEARRDRAGE